MTTGQTILVIDDQVSLARAFALALERDGYVVHTAHTAEDGLRLADQEHPAAIILDFQMPFINGTGFLYRLRASSLHRDTPVMVVTGATVTDEILAELAELKAVLRLKPFALSQLRSEVHAMLGNSSPASAATHPPAA